MWRINWRKTRVETGRPVTTKRSWCVRLLMPWLSDTMNAQILTFHLISCSGKKKNTGAVYFPLIIWTTKPYRTYISSPVSLTIGLCPAWRIPAPPAASLPAARAQHLIRRLDQITHRHWGSLALSTLSDTTGLCGNCTLNDSPTHNVWKWTLSLYIGLRWGEGKWPSYEIYWIKVSSP